MTCRSEPRSVQLDSALSHMVQDLAARGVCLLDSGVAGPNPARCPASTGDPLPVRSGRAIVAVSRHPATRRCSDFSPRPEESYRVGGDVRVRTLDVPRDGASRPDLNPVVRYGLGIAIAYDVLTAVDGAPQVNALLTVGRPLGICGVQDKLSPPWSRDNGGPTHRLGDGPWSNMYDLMDSVCSGFDQRIAGGFLGVGVSRVTDSVTNVGGRRKCDRQVLRRLFE
jgi:hypothetical protein